MKFLLSVSIVLFAFTLTLNASTVQKEKTVQADTLKKGKNFILHSQTANIDRVTFGKNKKTKQEVVYIHFGFPTPVPSSNSINGTVLQSNRSYKDEDSLPVFEKIDILKGKYEDIKLSRETKLKNLFTLTGVQFPLRLKLNSGKETIDLELSEAGEWNITIELKNN
ncbi:MAG: hypothetical protein EOO87_01540 [Pedobacter sp.]|nr:MAG: hypothetical protein EOO87_01540 [Pedobacter sp.]